MRNEPEAGLPDAPLRERTAGEDRANAPSADGLDDPRRLVRDLSQLLLAPAFAAFDPARIALADDMLARIRASAGHRDHVTFAIARVGVWLDQHAQHGTMRMPLETALAFLSLALDPAPMTLQVPAAIDVQSNTERRDVDIPRELPLYDRQVLSALHGRACLCNLDLLGAERGVRHALAAWRKRERPGDVASWYAHAEEASRMLATLGELVEADGCQAMPPRTDAVEMLYAAARRCELEPDSRHIAAAALRDVAQRIVTGDELARTSDTRPTDD